MTSARRRASCMALAEWCGPAGLRIEWSKAERIAADPSAAPEVAAGGDPADVRMGGQFHDDQDGYCPNDALCVYARHTVTTGRDGGVLVTERRKFWGEGGFILARSVAKSRGLWKEAAALAMMHDGPHDVRPHLLLLHVGQVRSEIAPCVRYGRDYLRAWCERAGEMVRADACEAAAADGLARVYWGRKTRNASRVTAEDRAQALRMRKAVYLVMVRKVEDAFRMRLAEAVVLFGSAMGDGPELLAPAKRYHRSRNNELPACNSSLARRAA